MTKLFLCGIIKKNEGDGCIMAEEILTDNKRSLAYPAATLEECFDVLNAIKALGGKSCSAQAIATKMGVSITTKSFKAKISSSKQYGFIDNIKSVIQLAERGRSLIYPTSTVVERNVLLECFQSPPLYAKLIQNFLGKALPSTEKLSNELIKPLYGITVTAKDNAAECFVKNAEFVGALQNGILTFENVATVEQLSENIEETEEDISEEVNNKTDTQKSIQSSKQTSIANTGYHFQIPMLSGATAEIYLPDNIKIIDLDFFEQSVNCMLPLFIKNLKTTLSESENKTESE